MKSLIATTLAVGTVATPSLAAGQPAGNDSHIHVEPKRVLHRLTPWMYGSCIEDVNHEIYGGLYAQRLFGESFEEPSNAPVAGWTPYGGQWRIEGGALYVGADPGAKLLRDTTVVADGTVACDVRFPDTTGDNAGLILRVSDPKKGADNWEGYEISMSARHRALVLGRHRHNWEPIETVNAPIEVGRWHRLRVMMQGPTLRIYLDDNTLPLLTFTDDQHPLTAGMVGVRTWNSDVSFRNLTITTPETTLAEAFDGARNNDRHTASGGWDPVVTSGVSHRFIWHSGNAYNTDHWQQITHLGGKGTVGIANRGLNRWGIPVRAGQAMLGRLYLHDVEGNVPVIVALQSAEGSRTYAEQRLAPVGKEWTRRNFKLLPNATDANARFVVLLDRPGSVGVDQAYLSDTGKALFHGGPFRADIGNALVQQGLTFLRYGGTMVNAPGYRWKQMIGDRDKRPQYRGHWYPYSTNGFGIEEFVQFCRSADIEPAFAINIEETPEDAADLVEYLNGPVTSVWGAKRAANGHREPYNVRYIEIGNEEALDGSVEWYRRYLDRFKRLYAAMHPRDPNVEYVISAWWRPEEPLCKQIAQELAGKATLWDVHVGGDNLRDGEDTDRTLTQMRQLFAEWIPGSPLKACIFEENGGRHDFQRALGHARILNVAQRHGDFVQMDCPANCLQPFGQNDNDWDQGQLFFLPHQVWGMPPYYAQQMAAQNHLPLCVASETTSPNNDLDVTTTRSDDGKTLVLKVVNSGATAHQTDIQLAAFVPAKTPAEVWTLSGELTDVNTPEAPERVRPVKTQLTIAGATFSYVFPRYSYTILRLRRR